MPHPLKSYLIIMFGQLFFLPTKITITISSTLIYHEGNIEIRIQIATSRYLNKSTLYIHELYIIILYTTINYINTTKPQFI